MNKRKWRITKMKVTESTVEKRDIKAEQDRIRAYAERLKKKLEENKKEDR
jgi:hypothetical protein